MLKKIFFFVLCLVWIFMVSDVWATGFTTDKFMINTSDFTISGEASDLKWGTAQETIQKTLGTIIQKMMIGIWIVSFVILVVWAAFMIFAAWEDEYVNRWKSIFTAGMIALIVSLLSYYMVALVRFLVFTN